MSTYRIFRLNAEHAAHFRTAAPGALKPVLKRGRYVETGAIDADGPYEAWKLLQDDEGGALGVGDALQCGSEPPLLCTYWGFDPTNWDTPEEGTEAQFSAEQVENACVAPM